MHLFLDANVYLSFYLFGKDDLDEMKKVVKLIKDEEITLHSNTHLKSEINRNRENKIAEGFSSIRSINFSREYPHYFGDYPELAMIKTALKEAAKQHSILIEKAQADINKRTLRADRLISELLDLGTNDAIDTSNAECAVRRGELGEPPGKKGSIGDAIHWLNLLGSNAYSVDIVSLDADFSSPLYPERINPYLGDEWERVKKFGEAQLFRSLADYFKSRFPSVTLSAELEKDALITRLIQSSNFSETHSVIDQLSKFSGFTKAQIRSLFSALLENTQVRWIASDPDVHEFYLTLKDQAWHLDSREINAASELLHVPDDYFGLSF